jgi:hypothetical protein|tara:strand:+ start:420 stop:653 length:234 start_codon:yes stop_codon:yes gene_type:complete
MLAKTTKWILPVAVNKDGDTIIEFPDDLLNVVDWKEGDTLDWTVDGNGLLTIKRIGEMVKLSTQPVEEQLNLNLEQE